MAGLSNLWIAIYAVSHNLRAFVAGREINGDPDLWTPETGDSPFISLRYLLVEIPTKKSQSDVRLAGFSGFISRQYNRMVVK